MDRIQNELTVAEGFQALLFRDGAFDRLLAPGRHVMPAPSFLQRLAGARRPVYESTAVDMRDRDLTIKGQEILTVDKVALRVSLLVQFRVVDAAAAVRTVADFHERLYSDVQLAARRALASMSLEEILTERNRLSEEILREVKDPAARYGVEIRRADVKDLVFPGNLQDIMNKVLAAERQAQASLIDARTRAEITVIETAARAENERVVNEKAAESRRLLAAADAEVTRMQAEAEVDSLRKRRDAAAAYADHPALLRLAELQTLRELARSGQARLYVDFGSTDRARRDAAGDSPDQTV